MGFPIQIGRAALWTIAITLIDKGVEAYPTDPYIGGAYIIGGGVIIVVAEYLYENGYIPAAVLKALKKLGFK